MSLKAKIQEDVKSAMRAKEKARLATLRLITAAIKQIEVDKRIELDDAAVLAVLEKMVKQRNDSIEQFSRASRDDLIQIEKDELVIIKDYLPEQLSEDAISIIVAEVIAATGAESMKDMGKVMGQIKAKIAGQADMGLVSKLIKAKLS